MNSLTLRDVLPLALLAVVISVLLVEPAAAQSLAGAENILQNFIDALTSNITRLIAIIAAIFIGFGFLFGYVDLRTVGYFIIGCIIVFGASELVDMIASS